MPRVFITCAVLVLAAPRPLWAQGLPAPKAAGPPPAAPAAPAVDRDAPGEPRVLTLPDALSLALRYNPDIAAHSQELSAIEGAVLQAEALPNPVLEIGGDNLDNARKAEAGDRAVFLQIGQLIELGGKRTARLRMAEAGRDLASWDREAKRIEILSQVALRFVDVLASQEREALARDSMRLAQQVADTAAKRVQSGKVSPVEETKARLALASAEVDREQARREFAAGRRSLGALWGNADPRFEKVAGELDRLVPLPAQEQLAARLRNSPDLARWAAESARRQAALEAEKAKVVPDVTVTAGVSRFSHFDDHAYMVSIALPIPVFDRNQGGVLEANRRLDKAADERRAAETRLLTELAKAYERQGAIQREIETLRTTLLPGAQSAFEAATLGYQLGKFGFLDVLDAQRTLFQARSQHLRAMADYQRGIAEIERLIGGPLDERMSRP